MPVIMTIDELQKHLKTENVEFRGNCHDCKCPVSMLCATNEDGSIIVTGGAMYSPKINGIEYTFFKCDGCYSKDKTLRNWQPCEIYSRVVGYLRPVKQWNKGKQEEFKQRKVFTLKEVKSNDTRKTEAGR